jgi:ElaB/YqjD/DUF883 family membrane-anchored ribosome-binding protein
MADTKNENAKSSTPSTSTGKQAGGADTSGKVSAGTSVGNIGEAPMPHAHEGAKNAQGASKGQPSNQSSQQNAQDQSGSITDKAQQAADQVRRKASSAYEDASDWAEDTYERVSDWASDAYGSQRQRMNRMGRSSAKSFGSARGGVQSYVSENPMVVGLVGLAAGLLLGALLPRTRRENEFFGEWSDEVRNQGMRYARDAANRGREYVEETFSGEDPQFSRHDSEFKPGNGNTDATSRH